NYGIVLLIIAIAGLVYLFKKNWKFASCSVLLIIFNFIIISLYLPFCPPNYVLNTMMIISVYLAFGFLLIYDSARLIAEKRININPSKLNALKIIISSVLLVLFLISPALFAVKNYKKADFSKPLEIYVFWNEIFDQMEDNSVLYVSSSAANIGEFINKYERQDQNITIITNKDERYSVENIRKNIAEGKKLYFLGIEDKLRAEFNVEKITGYTWKRMQEYIVFYSYAGEKKDLAVEYEILKTEIEYGKKFEVEYTIINDNDTDLEITSLELMISEGLGFIGVSQNGDIFIEPSLSQGKYMWVKTFPIRARDKINIILTFQARVPGDAKINFAVTSQNYYFKAGEIYLDIFN
ncbi:MAG: hypothetical protein JW997_02730, partial [Actinobacteria bacterium]|nr:hypothetical protein [Actinomycetota bacterium]